MESTNKIEYDLKDDIELTDLTINYDYMWQDIIKSLYDIDKEINIDYIIKDINLDIMREPYVLYLREKYQEHGKVNTYKEYIKIRNKFEYDWNNNIVDKNYYIKKYNQLKSVYDRNMAIVTKYLFLYKDFINKLDNKPFNMYFIDQIIINNGKDDIEVIKDLAKTNWDNNQNNIKNKYKKMNEKINKYINNNKDKVYISGLTLFIKEKINSSDKLKNKEVRYFKNLWKKLNYNQKKQYINKAKIENIKNEVLLNVNELSSDKIEISQRNNPYQIFRKEFRDLDYVRTISNCREKFNNLDNYLKGLYDIKCHRFNLINSYKKIINKEKNRLKNKPTIKQEINNSKEKKNEINAEKNIINKKENNNSQINIINDNQINDNIIDNSIEDELDLDSDYKVYEEPPKPKLAYDYFFELNRHKFTGDDFSDILYDLWNQMEQNEKFEYIHQEYNDNRLYKYRLKEFKEKGYYDRTKTLINYENNYIEINNRTYSIPIEPPTAKDVFIYTYIERNHLPYNKENIDALSNIWETELDDNIKLSYIEIEKSNRILYMYRMHEYKNYGYYDKNKTIDDYESL